MDLSVVIKPTHRCNFSCTYCYNDDHARPLMDPETLRNTISRVLKYAKRTSSITNVTFTWHGGEPLLVGIDFYKEVVKLQKEFADGVSYVNCMQTNGALINPTWIEFFKEHNFSVSVSLDGPPEIHNKARMLANNKATFNQVMTGINYLRAAGMAFGVIAVITKHCIGRAKEMYEFFAKEKLPFHIVPLTKQGDANKNYEDLGIDPEDYSDFWIEMYDIWFSSKGEDHIACRDFIHKSTTILTGKTTDCEASQQCAVNNISIDPAGYVYPCATFAWKEQWRYGNINDAPLEQLVGCAVCKKAKTREVDPVCTTCKWRPICNGGCYSRAENYTGSIKNRDYYCGGLYRMYTHIGRTLNEQGLKVFNQV